MVMCLGSLRKKRKNKDKKDKKDKKKKDKKPQSRGVNINNNTLKNSPEQKLDNENQPIQEKQVDIENLELSDEIIIPEPTLENENQAVQEIQENKENVEDEKKEKDISSSTTSSSSSSPPTLTITSPNTEQIISPNEKQVLDHSNDDSNDINRSKIEGNVKHFSDMSVGKVAGKAALQIFTTSLAAAQPFFPWIETVTTVINEIVDQYDTIVYNKKTCLVLIERVEMISLSVKTLTRRREENFETFQNETYYHSFIRLHKVLKLVKEFICDISELKGYRKFILASEVKDKANQLLDKLDECCKDLQFAIIITGEMKRREQQSLDDDVASMTKFLASIEKDVASINVEGEKNNKVMIRIYEEVSVIHQMIAGISADGTKETFFSVPKINPKDLYEAPEETSYKNVRKRLLHRTIPVACIRNSMAGKNEPKRVQAHLSILKSVQSSNKIIKFHGKSEIKDDNVLVFDWAVHGNLKMLYKSKDLSWVNKLDIAHDIASGLVFLQACKILHHDIKCENILITGDARYEAKIANFQESREDNDVSHKIETYSAIIRWLAPEKMPKEFNKPSKEPYTFKCEIFSFGMLLWELGAQKLPYEKMEMNEIMLHVKAKKREDFKRFNTRKKLDPANDESIIKGFMRIIESAWVHDSSQRPTIQDLYQELDSLVGTHSPRIHPKRSSSDVTTETLNNDNNDNDNDSTTTIELEDDDHFEALEQILTIDEGIAAHREGNKEEAWKCFKIHAELGDPVAIYWQAYYYMKGYHVQQNTSEAIKYFKQAADANMPEAQYHYANAIKKAKKFGFLDYFTKAAENGYAMAQRELGLVYYYGNGVRADKEKGIQYLKLAALKNNNHAINDLNKIDPSILSDKTKAKA